MRCARAPRQAASRLQPEADQVSIESLNRVHDFHYAKATAMPVAKKLDRATVLRLAAQLDEAHEQSNARTLETRHCRGQSAALESGIRVRDLRWASVAEGPSNGKAGFDDQRSSKPDGAAFVQNEVRSQTRAALRQEHRVTCSSETHKEPKLSAASFLPEPTPAAPVGPWALVVEMGLPSKGELDELRCFGELPSGWE
jgi:hypothetical protein